LGNKRGRFEIRYKPTNHGRDGGLGPVRSFLATLSRGTLEEAQKKLRTPGVVIGIKSSKDKGNGKHK
jgi:hypothetical protein